MKKTLLPLILLLIVNFYNTDAQSVQQTAKNKADSIKKSAINDPVGAGKKILDLFKHKPATSNPASQSSNVSVNNGTGTANIPTTTNVSTNINTPAPNNSGVINGNSKTINNGLIFSIVQCIGDKAAQSITITFTLSNPNKANQIVIVGSLNQFSNNNPGLAIDANGNPMQVANVSLSTVTARYVTTELPTGITLRGTITLINALPTSSNLQYFKIPIASQNGQGGGDKQGTIVEERNIPVAWNN